MIIRLKGATFTTNIGTLDSWSIKYTTTNGSVTKKSGALSIKKDDTDGEILVFEFDTAKYTYKSGTIMSNGVSAGTINVSGNTITVNVNAGTTLGGKVEINFVMEAIGGGEPEEPDIPPSSDDIADLVSAYSTSMTSTQQSALSAYVNTIKANSTLASKIKKMYMPILSTTLDDVRINVADYINNNTATVDTFSGTWNESTYGFKNNGIYNTTSSTTVYTTTGISGMSGMKMNNLGLISVFNITAGSTNGTRLSSTGSGCFFLRNYSAGNAAVQGTHSGQTGTYCGKDLSELYGVPAGYFQNKSTAPCIDMMMFSGN